jgi:ABC-2 type transport system ATP-binding protein
MNSAIPLSVHNVSKSFKHKQVLNDTSFALEPSEIFGLIGLNGAGKTTLIKIILDLLNADMGSAEFFGQNIKSPDSRRNICYLPEKFYPSQFLTGKEFIELSLSYFAKHYDAELTKFIADKLDLDFKVLDHKIGKYSKGMGQKLGLISVFLSEAPLLILDEPMSGLDPTARIQLKNLLLSYRDQSKKTVFFSSHILSDIDEICDRIAVIDDAQLLFVGTPQEFKARYNNNDKESLEAAFIKAIKKE